MAAVVVARARPRGRVLADRGRGGGGGPPGGRRKHISKGVFTFLSPLRKSSSRTSARTLPRTRPIGQEPICSDHPEIHLPARCMAEASIGSIKRVLADRVDVSRRTCAIGPPKRASSQNRSSKSRLSDATHTGATNPAARRCVQEAYRVGSATQKAMPIAAMVFPAAHLVRRRQTEKIGLAEPGDDPLHF